MEPNRILDLTRGLVAAMAALLALVGVPVLLTVLWGVPLPSEVPDLATVRATLTAPDDGSFLIDLIGLAAWIGWLWFAVGFIWEVMAVVGRRVTRPVRPGTPRWAARALVASIALAVVPTAGGVV